MTPVTDVVLTLPRLCGNRDAATHLLAGQTDLRGKTILIVARAQSVGTEDYADELLRLLAPQQTGMITLVGHTKNFGRYMRQAARRHHVPAFAVLT